MTFHFFTASGLKGLLKKGIISSTSSTSLSVFRIFCVFSTVMGILTGVLEEIGVLITGVLMTGLLMTGLLMRGVLGVLGLLGMKGLLNTGFISSISLSSLISSKELNS